MRRHHEEQGEAGDIKRPTEHSVGLRCDGRQPDGSWRHEAALSETRIRVAGDHEVIVDGDAHKLPGLDELARDTNVLARRLDVSWGRGRARCSP